MGHIGFRQSEFVGYEDESGILAWRREDGEVVGWKRGGG